MTTAHVIVGSTGAGKTTYARKLSTSQKAMVFSIDEWMKNLFWMDAAKEPNINWALERVRRCETQIWLIAERLLELQQDVILDLGFSKQEHRERFIKMIIDKGYTAKMHYLDIPVDVRRERVKHRNQTKSGTFEFEVDDATFDWMEGYFEAPTVAELENAVIIKS